MQRITVEPKTVVYEIVCDRCGKEVRREGSDFELMTSIGFEAGYASIFGDGNRLEIDLCEPCVRGTLGTWLRVRTPEDTSLARMLDKFKPEVHGGEFAGRDPQSLGDLVRSAEPADAEEAVVETPPARTSVFIARGSQSRNCSIGWPMARGWSKSWGLFRRSVATVPVMRCGKRRCGFRRMPASTWPQMFGRRGIRTSDDPSRSRRRPTRKVPARGEEKSSLERQARQWA